MENCYPWHFLCWSNLILNTISMPMFMKIISSPHCSIKSVYLTLTGAHGYFISQLRLAMYKIDSPPPHKHSFSKLLWMSVNSISTFCFDATYPFGLSSYHHLLLSLFHSVNSDHPASPYMLSGPLHWLLPLHGIPASRVSTGMVFSVIPDLYPTVTYQKLIIERKAGKNFVTHLLCFIFYIYLFFIYIFI